jgi:hypothetical protein
MKTKATAVCDCPHRYAKTPVPLGDDMHTAACEVSQEQAREGEQ